MVKTCGYISHRYGMAKAAKHPVMGCQKTVNDKE
jgi:hypothetical protein